MKKPLLFLSLFIFSFFNSIAQAPATCTAAIGSPANGAAHYISVTWATVGGASSYDLEYSTDGSSWNNLYSGTSTSYNHNTGAVGNLPYYYRARATVGSPSAWTNSTQYPIYSACDVPALPFLSNANPYSMNIDVVPETPDANPSYTTYSIYCTTTSQYVQANGTLGGTEVFQANSAWGNILVNGFSESTNYCFYLKAKNMDGDVRMAEGANILAVEMFTTNANFATGSSTTTKFWSPASCTTGGLTYSASGGCTGGYVGKTGSFNNYFGCFLRTPAVNCTGNTSVVLNFDISNSYFANHPNDMCRFTMWVDGGYQDASSVKINGVEVGYTDINGLWLRFDQARTCVNVDVTFDITGYSNLTNILFYIEPQCGYNNSDVFSVKLDNISMREGGIETACQSTSACVASGIATAPPENVSVCDGSDTTLSITYSGNPPTYVWEVSTDGGANWTPVVDDATYFGTTTATLGILNIPSGFEGYQYHCLANFPCGGIATSNFATLHINTPPSAPLEIGGPGQVCDGSSANFAFGAVNGATSYTWTLPNGWSGTSTSTSMSATAELNSGNVSVTANNACGSSAQTNLYVIVDQLPSVAFDPSEQQFCITDGPFSFDGATPSGGLFSGTGVVGSNFNPSSAGTGTHQICYTYTDLNGCAATSCESFIVDLCTGINTASVEELEVFPNPFTDFVLVKFNAIHENGFIVINDFTGKEISKTLVPSDEKQMRLTIPATAKGMYSFTFVSASGEMQTLKLQHE